jgi:hypothetical protein
MNVRHCPRPPHSVEPLASEGAPTVPPGAHARFDGRRHGGRGASCSAGLDGPQKANAAQRSAAFREVSERAPARAAPYEQVKQMRASVLVLGPLVARYGRAEGVAARRLRHRRSAHRPAPQGPRGHGRHHHAVARLRARRVPSGRLRGAEIVLRHAHRHGHREPDDGRRPRRGPHHAGQRRARARGRGAGARAQQDGRRVEGAGTDVIHIEGARACPGRPRHHAGPHRGRHLHGGAAASPAATCWSRAPRSRTSRRSPPRCAARAWTSSARARACVVVNGPLRSADITTAPHPGFSHGHAGAVHGADVPRAGHAASSPRPSSRTASCTCRSSTAWAPTSTCTAAPRW